MKKGERPDLPERLELLAEWLDMMYPKDRAKGTDQTQTDLRLTAARLRELDARDSNPYLPASAEATAEGAERIAELENRVIRAEEALRSLAESPRHMPTWIRLIACAALPAKRGGGVLSERNLTRDRDEALADAEGEPCPTCGGDPAKPGYNSRVQPCPDPFHSQEGN